ncbi:MAG: M56 family metallopeptidase [Planctomycetota bacterium]|nr:MAG: M56 family metallopeptidase [Planctomycetota bacterium]
MESFINELSTFFRWLLVCSLQVSVLICLVLAIKAALGGRLAIRWHYWLWLLLLVRMIMPWAPESKFSIFTFISQAKKTIAAQEADEVTFEVKTVGAEPKAISNLQRQDVRPEQTTSRAVQISSGIRSLSPGLVETLSLAWLLIAFALAVFAMACNLRLWRIIKYQRPLTEGKILDLLEDCKAEMGIQTILGVVVTDRVKSPSLFGVVRPRLLLPEGILKTLSTEELRYVFLHELAHLKRNDIYLGWLMVVLQILHWFNPLVWFAFGRMRVDRELACDGLVLSTTGSDNSQAYGQTLVNLFKGFSQIQFVPGIAGVLENKSQLKRRITMIAQFKKGSYQWSVLAVVLLAVLGGVALTNAETAESLSDLNAKVAQLDIDNAVLDDVIYVFGEPLKYVWGNVTIPAEEIPTDRYCMEYAGFSIFMTGNFIRELRFESPAGGYVFQDGIRVGSSLDEVLAVLGEPSKTVEGEPINWRDVDGVLYMDIDGEEGRCYYQRPDWNVRMFFANYKVMALYVTSKDSTEFREKLREEDLPPTSFVNEDGRIVDKVDYPFVNDPELIGCWESVDYVGYIEDFNPNKRSYKGNLFRKELFIFENGRAKPFFTWTKGLILDRGDRTASEYIIDEINGTTYMFLEDKDDDYTIRHMKPALYVLKKVPYRPYVESRTYDKVDYPFVDDPEVIGTWDAIDFVETPEEFDPGHRRWTGGEMFLSQLVIEPNGQMSQILGKQVTEARRAESKRVRESFLAELGVDLNGEMSEILNKSISDFNVVWAKLFGQSFPIELDVDPSTKMTDILKKGSPLFEQVLEQGVSESFLEEVSDPNTKISDIVNKQRPWPTRVWTKGLIIEPAAKKASRYQIREIQGATYMFYEWKSGDYVLRQMKPKYYVLKKR